MITITADNKIFVEGPDLPRTEVEIIDNGEGYDPNEKGTIPNHDKVEIVYISPKA